jgi:hypothetical protein
MMTVLMRRGNQHVKADTQGGKSCDNGRTVAAN